MQKLKENPATSFSRSIRDYKDVLTNLTLRDFKLRYRNSVLGFFWSLLNPLFMTLIFSIIFSFLFSSGVTDYPVFVLPSILLWRFFSVSNMYSLDTISGNYQLITKIYFPRWLLIASNALANLIGSTLEFVACFPILMAFGMRLNFSLILIPLIVIEVFVLNLGLGLGLSALNLLYRDIRQIWEILVQAGFYFSPVFYSISIIPAKFRAEYMLNPMTAAIQSIRDVTYYGMFPSASEFGILLAAGLVIVLVGGLIFNSIEGRFGDVV
jgi:lipopolysaccharide transport system permease protein